MPTTRPCCTNVNFCTIYLWRCNRHTRNTLTKGIKVNIYLCYIWMFVTNSWKLDTSAIFFDGRVNFIPPWNVCHFCMKLVTFQSSYFLLNVCFFNFYRAIKIMIFMQSFLTVIFNKKCWKTTSFVKQKPFIECLK